jgi:DNA-binding Lrp family transcriptional regulator
VINTTIGQNQSTCYSNNATVYGSKVLSSADKTNSENTNPRPRNLRTKNQLHKIIVNEDGYPDYLAVNLYWDSLRSWYNPKKIYKHGGRELHIAKLRTKGIFLNYKKLSEYYNCSRETIRRKLVKLEQLGLIHRSFQHKKTANANCYNQMIIYVWKDTPHFFNNYGVAGEDVESLQPYTSHLHVKEKYGISFDKQNLKEHAEIEVDVRNDVDTKELNKLFSKEKIRSSESNFYKNSLEVDFEQLQPLEVDSSAKNNSQIEIEQKTNIEVEVRVEAENNQYQAEITNSDTEQTMPEFDSFVAKTGRVIRKVGAKVSKFKYFAKPRKLADFYPLNQDDCYKLQTASGREFNLNAMNEILLNMSKRLPDRSFYSHKGFISYMTKAFTYEKRDAVKINNDTFKISANKSHEQIRTEEIEKYLDETESSVWITPEAHLKRKLANVLAPNKAYDLLKAYRSISIEGQKVRIDLTTTVELSALDKNIILQQIKATHESVGMDGDFVPIETLEIKMPDLATSLQASKQREKSLKRTGIWGRVRKGFIKAFGVEGEALDQSWLSKLDAQIDEQNQTIGLKAPSSFYKDFIEERYLPYVIEVAKECGFSIKGISC